MSYFISCPVEKIENPPIYPTPTHAVSPVARQKLVHFWPGLRVRGFNSVFRSGSFGSSCFYFGALPSEAMATQTRQPLSILTLPGFSAGQWSSPLLSETSPCPLPLPVLLYILTPLCRPFWFTPRLPLLFCTLFNTFQLKFLLYVAVPT